MPHKPTSRIPALDGLRGLAVLMVFCYHYAGGAHSNHWLLRVAGGVNEAGWSGVTLFFVLSGFLITGILWDSSGQPHWQRKFYIRRALRILPLYFGALLLAVIAAGFAGNLAGALRPVWIYVLFLQNVPGLAEQFQSPLIVYHLWTITVEEQFYLLWPLLFLIPWSRRNAARVCIITFCLSLAFRIALCASGRLTPDSASLLLSRAGELAVGGWLAITYRSKHWNVVQRIAPGVLAVSITLFALTSWMQGSATLAGGWQFVGGVSAATFAFAALLVLVLRPGWWQRAMSASCLRWLGTMSFGIYVFHLLLRPLYWKVTHRIVAVSSGGTYFATRFLVAAVATLLISSISYRFYETPFLRLKRRFAPYQS